MRGIREGSSSGGPRTRRRLPLLAAGFLAAALVAACGSSSKSAGPTVSTPSGTASPGAATTAAPASTTCSQPVKIGVSYSSDEGQQVAGAGAAALAAQAKAAQQRSQATNNLIVSYVNAHGGLGGCQVKLVYHNFLTQAASGFSGQSQSECIDFAEDQHVFAVIPQIFENKTLTTCLAQHHVVELFNGGEYWPTTADFNTDKGFLYAPDYINPDRTASFVQLWNQAGFFGTGAKVAILVANDGSGTDQYVANNLWKPALQKLGIDPMIFTFTKVEADSQVPTTGSEFQSAVLKFENAGINRVILAPDADDAGALFTQQANSQHFTPRYAMSTLNASMGSWATIPTAEQPGAVGISFWYTDLGTAGTPPALSQNPSNTARQTCDSIYGGHTGSAPTTTEYGLCDDYFFLQAALKGASGTVSYQNLLSGADNLGSTLTTANGYSNATISSGHYDGGTQVRVLTWNATTKQWGYVTGPVSVP